MAATVNQLRASGFSDQEISEWANGERQKLLAAGFRDNEIDAHLTGGPVVQDAIPPALDARLQAGAEAHKREGGLINTIPAFANLMMTPDGRTKLWNAVKQYPSEFINGMIEQAKVPGKVVEGTIDINTPGGMDEAIGLGMLVGLGRFNKLNATGKTSGLSIAQGEHMGRIQRDAMGNIHVEPVGELPKSQDFVDAATVATGEPLVLGIDNPKIRNAVIDKLNSLYKDHGYHPAEVATDARKDPVVAQSLLSSDPKDLPYATERQRVARLMEDDGSSEPPKPPTPPKPPEPGSFEEAQQKILSKISVGEREPGAKITLDKIYTQAVDDLFPIRKVSEEAYQLARLARGQYGKAQQFLENSTFDFATYRDVGPGLKKVLEPVKDDLDGFRAYLASKRALNLEERGLKSGFDPDAAKAVVERYGNRASEFESARRGLEKYQDATLDYLQKSGVLSEDAVKAMREANANYVPFYRLIGGEGGGPKGGKSLGPANPIKRLKGSERDTIDPLESIIKNTYAYISIAERNAAGSKLISALEDQGFKVERKPAIKSEADLDAYLREQGVSIPEALTDFIKNAAPEDGQNISAYKNGVRETVKIDDPDLVNAFRALDQRSADMLVKVLAAPAKLLRAGATLSPDFIVRNLVRDFQTAFINTKGTIFSPADTARGLRGLISKDADFQNWLKSGGANSTLVALDRRYLQESLRDLIGGDASIMQRSWNVVSSPVRGLRMLSELAENATRLGEFKKIAGGSTSKETIQQGGFSSREVTLDFARIGASMRSYNMITAFANAQIQGMDRLARAFKDNPTQTTARVAAGVTLPSVLLWFANHDDPRYKELPDWQKDLFWIVLTKDHIWRIPKPFEVGVIFGSGAERALDATIGKNPEAFDKFSKSVMDAFVPNYIPTAGQPLFEQFANRSTFTDRTLIPSDMEKFLPEYQYKPYTTELAKSLGRIFSGLPGVRNAAVEEGAAVGPFARALTTPILIENYIRAWTGGLGMYALNGADAALRKTGVLPDPVKPADTLADIPVVKAFAVRYPTSAAKSIQDFYDDFAKNEKFFTTWQSKAQEGDAEAMQRIQDAGGPEMFVQLSGIKETLSEHSKLVRDIAKNPEIDKDEKRQLIDTIYSNMIELAQAGRQIQRETKAALGR